MQIILKFDILCGCIWSNEHTCIGKKENIVHGMRPTQNHWDQTMLNLNTQACGTSHSKGRAKENRLFHAAKVIASAWSKLVKHLFNLYFTFLVTFIKNVALICMFCFLIWD